MRTFLDWVDNRAVIERRNREEMEKLRLKSANKGEGKKEIWAFGWSWSCWRQKSLKSSFTLSLLANNTASFSFLIRPHFCSAWSGGFLTFGCGAAVDGVEVRMRKWGSFHSTTVTPTPLLPLCIPAFLLPPRLHGRKLRSFRVPCQPQEWEQSGGSCRLGLVVGGFGPIQQNSSERILLLELWSEMGEIWRCICLP